MMNSPKKVCAEANFNAIGNTITTRIDILSLLSGRDKANLFRALADESGFIDALHKDADAPAGKTFQDAYNRLWEK